MNEEKKIIAIHQPYYLPWLGYFHKIYNCDIFVINDNIEYSKGDYTRRAKIENEKYLTIPLEPHSDFESIINIKTKDNSWRHDHINKINNKYRHHPFYKNYIEFIEYVIIRTKFINSLSHNNVQMLEDFLNLIGIKRKIERTSYYNIEGKKEDYVINIVKYFQGDIYLSGTGAKKYQNENNFNKNSIKLVYQDMYSFLNNNPYKQRGKQFVNGVSFIDALFNIGVDGILNILDSYKLDIL